jgi:oligopeptide transport system substrate-binding protein
MSPEGISGFDQLNPNSPWLPAAGDLAKAEDELSQAASPKKDITLFFNDSPGHKEIATAVQAQWKELGINTTLKQQEWAQFLEFLGPPPNNAVDVYRLGWIYDFPDAINGLELWTCDSGNNNTNFCDKNFDAKVAEAKAEVDDSARYDIYGELEQMLFGEDGALPITPIYWYTFPNLEKQSVKDSFFISPLDQIDFTKVVVTG